MFIEEKNGIAISLSHEDAEELADELRHAILYLELGIRIPKGEAQRLRLLIQAFRAIYLRNRT